ncbi:MAG: hypothetical protein KF712_13850 [Akkermansiaceae bacterium]|nr:hypothetical protein [Akkermansiaceae bacterium]
MLHFNPDVACCEDPAAGDLFPDLLNLAPNRENRGRVAVVIVKSYGIGAAKPVIRIDKEAWSKCFAHSNFDSNYRLSMAQLGLQQALF